MLLGQDPGQSSLIEVNHAINRSLETQAMTQNYSIIFSMVPLQGFTAGGFIYISVAGVLAEMNNNGSPSVKSSVSQLISLILGMAVALWISLVE